MTHLVLGELCADIIVRLDDDVRFGQAETLVPDTHIVMGSSSAITACGLALLGSPTRVVGVLGDDLLGRFLLDQLRERRVDSRYIRVDDTRPTGSSTILTRPDGDRAILTALGSIGQVRIDDVTPAALEGVRHVHVGSYFLQFALHGELGAWFARLRDGGITTSLDPNDDPSGEWDSGILDVLHHTDILFCNDAEARALSGTADPAATLTRLMPDGAQLLLKRGAAGAELHGRDGARLTCPAPADPRPLADTIGAGDSLSAGFLAARARGLSDHDALRIAVHNATASTRGIGGIAAQLIWEDADTS